MVRVRGSVRVRVRVRIEPTLSLLRLQSMEKYLVHAIGLFL